MGKTRRAITPADGVEVRRRVAWATELPEVDISIVFIGLVANGIRYIGSGKPRGLTAQEVASVAHAGIFPGRDGWEIEVRRELPAPWAWWTSRTEELTFQYLSQTDTLRGCIAQAWPDEALIYRVPGAHGILAKWPAESIDSARERAEDECWSRGLFGVVEDAPPVAAVEQADEEPAVLTDEGVERDPTVTTDVPQGAGMGAQVRGIEGLTSGEPEDFNDAEELLCQLLANEQGCAGDIERERIAGAFVARLKCEIRGEVEGKIADLRASLPAPPMPSPRTTDGALTAYLLEHHRDEWRPGDDALAMTIRLLDAARMRERLADGTAAVHASKMREVEEEREAFAAEARAAGALAATREQERDALANTAATLRRERDEAQADLAKMRDDVLRAHRDLAAKMGAPRG